MATIRHGNSVKILPQEICGLICQDPTLTRPDLFSLGAVSRAFRDEAERFLYTSARLRGKRKIKSFCVSVIRRPFLAVRLRQLVLFMPPQLDLEVDDLSRIMNALRLCNNLRHLSVFQDYSRAIPQLNADAVHSWILDGHSFRLKSLANSYFEPGHLVRFLKHQPSIETLAIKCKGYSGLDSAPLPMLKNLDSSARVVQEFGLDAWQRTTMERLQFSLIGSTDSEELTTFVALTPFTSTLKSLSIRRKNGDDGLDISVLVACVATQLPDLKFLQILDYTAKVRISFRFIAHLFTIISPFRWKHIMFPFFRFRSCLQK